MTGRVMELTAVLEPDQRAVRITERWLQWETLRQVKKNDWEEIRRYVYATNTTQTTNVQLPWKNKTTVPKLCQIRDNLLANYTATLFPTRKWLKWEANERDSASKDKRDAITNYMSWVVSQPMFKHEIEKIIMDYIDFGNCFATVEWLDQRVQLDTKTQVGYVGPMVKRINPLDIVFNPTAENFIQSPKIIRTITSMGEVKEMLQRMSNDENRDEYEKLYTYLKDIRARARTFQGDWIQRDHLYSMDGFTSFRAYLISDYVEILTFYGDYYDWTTDTFEKNKVITVIDRHKLIGDKPNPSYFAYPPIFHVPWRKKQDNLWGMGPLDNLIGMQYRLDHVENMKADVFDLITYPVQKVKGFVEDFTWQPGEKIFVSEEGDVELVCPDVQALNANLEIRNLQDTMEMMAGAPKEAAGFRTPGEKTKYEVQQLENAAARIFSAKILQFSDYLDLTLNALLELARRQMNGVTTIPVFDDLDKVTLFQDLTVEDITGVGRVKAVSARHFVEDTQLIQNLTGLSGSPLWQFVQPHFSSIKTAKLLESKFDMEDYDIVVPFVALAEQTQGQNMMNALEEQVHQQAGTATGMGEDYDLPPGQQAQPIAPPNEMLRKQGR
jgi:hypothetical protein